MTRKTILIAGGGTGGHVFPAIAVAEAMMTLGNVEVVFCGTRRGLEDRVVPEHGFRLERLAVEPIRGGGPFRVARGALVALGATGQAIATVRALRPSAVLGVGGYAAGPVSLIAALSGVPLAILEPNSVAGLANRILGPMAKRAYVAWDEPASAFRRSSLRRYGVPLRAGFGPRPYAVRGTSTLLILGGSQGASGLNERMPPVLGRLARMHALNVLHQAGRGRDMGVRRAYAEHNVERATVVPFVDDVASAIAEADLVIARAGAGTLAEITAIGRAAILVPFPKAADDHQAKNAAALVRRGAAVSLAQADADTDRLTTEIHRLLGDTASRVAMANASRSLGRPEAAYDVAADLLALAGIGLHERAPPKQRNGAAPAIAPSAIGRTA